MAEHTTFTGGMLGEGQNIDIVKELQTHFAKKNNLGRYQATEWEISQRKLSGRKHTDYKWVILCRVILFKNSVKLNFGMTTIDA